MLIHGLSFDIFISEEILQLRIQEMGAELSQLFADKNPLFIIVLKADLVVYRSANNNRYKLNSFDNVKHTVYCKLKKGCMAAVNKTRRELTRKI